MTAASKKMNDFRGKSATELNTLLLDLRKEQMNLRFQRATGQLATTARMTEVRKDIARVSTQLSALTAQDKKSK